MNLAFPVMPLLHAGATGSEQDRWDLFGLALITLAFLLVTWVMLDVIGSSADRELPTDERATAPRPSRRATRQHGAPTPDTALVPQRNDRN